MQDNDHIMDVTGEEGTCDTGHTPEGTTRRQADSVKRQWAEQAADMLARSVAQLGIEDDDRVSAVAMAPQPAKRARPETLSPALTLSNSSSSGVAGGAQQQFFVQRVQQLPQPSPSVGGGASNSTGSNSSSSTIGSSSFLMRPMQTNADLLQVLDQLRLLRDEGTIGKDFCDTMQLKVMHSWRLHHNHDW
jgi:hypothetical protein